MHFEYFDHTGSKDPNNPLAIFVDTNLPPDRARRFYELRSRNPMIPSVPMASLMDKVRKDYGGVDPYNILVFSNHPQYYSEDDTVAPGSSWAGFISEKSRVAVPHQKALFDLFTAVNLYGNVPTHFPPNRTPKGHAKRHKPKSRRERSVAISRRASTQGPTGPQGSMRLTRS
jgi:hypothetical protein